MSLARIYETKTVRKDWKCGNCGSEIKKGVDGRISFAVGFRGQEQTRCTKSECFPTREERESSALAPVYGAIDSVDWDSVQDTEELESIRDEIANTIREVAEEYEANEMFEMNYDLQDRADTLQYAADEIEQWEAEEFEDSESDFQEWFAETVQSLRDVVEEVELP